MYATQQINYEGEERSSGKKKKGKEIVYLSSGNLSHFMN